MKSLKTILCLLLCCVLILPCFSVITFAEEAKDAKRNSVEIVVLLDVSGSMALYSDPIKVGSKSRRTIEALHTFAMTRPENTDIFIKVIPYCENVYDGFESVNIATNLNTYKNIVNDIATDKNNTDNIGNPDTVPGMSCFDKSSFTDIGQAMKSAEAALIDSKADKKAVILFTDGKISLPANGNINVDEANAESERQAYDAATKLNSMDAKLFSIGLNHKENPYAEDSVDKAFFAKLHGVSSVNDTTDIQIVEDSEKVTDAFNNIFEYLYDGFKVDEEPETFPIHPNIPVERTVHIYEHAVKEATIRFSSDAPLHTVEVITPNNVTIAKINLDAPEESKVESQFCQFDYTPSGQSVQIQLIDFPEGGDWTLLITGDEGVVVESELYLVALEVQDSIKDGDTVYVDDGLTFKASLHSIENKQQITSVELFDPALGAEGSVSVKPLAGGSAVTTKPTLDASGILYNCSVGFSVPGDYTITTTLKHKQYEEGSVKKLSVAGPKLVLSAPDGFKGEDGVKLTIKAVHPITGENLAKLPAYFNGAKCTLTVTNEKGESQAIEIDATKLTEGAVHTYNYPVAGKYSFKAEVISAASAVEETLASSESLELSFVASDIIVSEELPESVGKKALNGSFEQIIDLSDKFTDPEGDKLTYEVTTEGDSVVSAILDGEELIISTDDFGEGVVTLTVSDGRGSVSTYNIDVKVESAMGTVILIACIVLGLIVAAIIVLLIIRRKKIISIVFKVKVEKVDLDTYNSTEVIYSIPRLVTRKTAKPTMSLNSILNMNGFSTIINSTMDAGDIENFKNNYAPSFELTGVPFKKQFRIVLKPTDKKKKASKYLFNNKTTVNIKTADGAYTVSFGNASAFVQEFSW